MDLKFSKEDLAFREEVRTWISENRPREQRPMDRPSMREYDLAWQKTQANAGWAGISWPKEYGGRGASLIQALIWFEEYGGAGLPGIDACFVGLNHAGPTLMTRSSEEQKSYHLPKILGGDVVWCQGFSEPEAGSDLASLKAVLNQLSHQLARLFVNNFYASTCDPIFTTLWVCNIFVDHRMLRFGLCCYCLFFISAKRTISNVIF